MYIKKKKEGRTKSADPRLKEQIKGKIKSFCASLPNCITLVLNEGVDRRNLFRILGLVKTSKCRNISEKMKELCQSAPENKQTTGLLRNANRTTSM